MDGKTTTLLISDYSSEKFSTKTGLFCKEVLSAINYGYLLKKIMIELI